MKLIICGSRGIPAQYGGFESLTQALALNFTNLGHKVITTGFTNLIPEPILLESTTGVSYHLPTKAPRFAQNILCTWKATKFLDVKYDYDAAIVLNDVNYLVARKYQKMGVRTVLHLDGAEVRRSGLPIIGKLVHWLFRRLAIKSHLPLIVDSFTIKEELKLSNERVAVISYGPHLDTSKEPKYKNINLVPDGYFVAIARFVNENQIIELIEGFVLSKLDKQLVLIGLGTGSNKYQKQVIKAAMNHKNIFVLPKNYDRAEINWLLQNAKGYIHGHSVGGTNPILVDARLHSKLILSHDNLYNREKSGRKEHFWGNSDKLAQLLKNIDVLEVSADASDYKFDSWENIALQYLDLLVKRDINESPS
jgi:hypothetical protein